MSKDIIMTSNRESISFAEFVADISADAENSLQPRDPSQCRIPTNSAATLPPQKPTNTAGEIFTHVLRSGSQGIRNEPRGLFLAVFLCV